MDIPAFIKKLWHLVSDSETDNIICWGNEPTNFIIKDQSTFTSELLPKYYKHNNMASFTRQLNKYGFHKIKSTDSLSLKNYMGDLEFCHPNFDKRDSSLLFGIKRKPSIGTKSSNDDQQQQDSSSSANIAKLEIQIKQLQAQQEKFEAKLAANKGEHDALWREYSILRHKHHQHQNLINRLIQFLVSIVRGMKIRNTGPLMIKEEGSRNNLDKVKAIKDFIIINQEESVKAQNFNMKEESSRDSQNQSFTPFETKNSCNDIKHLQSGSNFDDFDPLSGSDSEEEMETHNFPELKRKKKTFNYPKNTYKKQKCPGFANLVKEESECDVLFEYNEQISNDTQIQSLHSSLDSSPNVKSINSSLVLSDLTSNQNTNNENDIAQPDLDSLKELLLFESRSLLSIFGPEDPLGLKVPESHWTMKDETSGDQEIVPYDPFILEIPDNLLNQEIL